MIWLLILCCITAKVLAAQKSLISAHLLIRDNRRLAGKAVKMVASSSVMSCSLVCLRHAWCTSSNFEESSRNCELNKHEFSLIDDDTKLTEKAGTTFTMVLKVRELEMFAKAMSNSISMFPQRQPNLKTKHSQFKMIRFYFLITGCFRFTVPVNNEIQFPPMSNKPFHSFFNFCLDQLRTS